MAAEFSLLQQVKGRSFEGHRLGFIGEVQKETESFGLIGPHRCLDLGGDFRPSIQRISNPKGIEQRSHVLRREKAAKMDHPALPFLAKANRVLARIIVRDLRRRHGDIVSHPRKHLVKNRRLNGSI